MVQKWRNEVRAKHRCRDVKTHSKDNKVFAKSSDFYEVIRVTFKDCLCLSYRYFCFCIAVFLFCFVGIPSVFIYITCLIQHCMNYGKKKVSRICYSSVLLVFQNWVWESPPANSSVSVWRSFSCISIILAAAYNVGFR